MKRIFIVALALFSIIDFAFAQTSSEEIAAFKSDTLNPALHWFPKAKFGIFIHNNLQNVPMTAQEQHDYKRDPKVARKIANRLDLSKYDARQQARLFKKWGARYVVMTIKHHVGFSLADDNSDFNVVNSSKVGRDITREYVDALRAEGLKVGFYFSLPDWTHPDYATWVDDRVPVEKRKKTRAYAIKNDTVRWNNFKADMHRQLQFLLTSYGPIDLIWFDGDWERRPEQWGSKEIAAMVHRLQPNCVINNRLRHIDLGHYITVEQCPPLADKGAWWEFSMTPGDNWDGPDADNNIKPVSELIRVYTDVIAMNGNVLVNVAPTDCGAISQKQIAVLDSVGEWMNSHAEAIWGVECNFPIGLFNGAVTRKGKSLYLFVTDGPTKEICLKGTNAEIASITDLKTGRELPWRYSGGYKGWNEKGFLYITIPNELLEENANVVKIQFTDNPVIFNTPSGVKYTF